MFGYLTAAIAFLGILIAYFQWRTGHQRVVLDVFERRVQVFEQLERAVQNVAQEAAVKPETFQLFVHAESKARFLFGDDVIRYLAALRKDFAFLLAFTNDAIDSDPNRKERIHQKFEALKRITAWWENGVPIFMPYMRLDQKMGIWLPFGRR